MTAAGRRVLEADPGVMDSLEGGEAVRMIAVGERCWPPSWTLPC